MRTISLLLALWLPAAAQVAPVLNLVIVEGEGATNNIRQRTAREPVVQVEDENHKPVAGAVVVFTLPGTGAGGGFANGARTLTILTDNQGRAVARGFRPTGQGQFQMRVNASHNGQTASATITQTNAIVAGSAGGSALSAKWIAVIAAAGAAVAGGAYYATHNGNGGATPVPPAATTIAAGTGSVGPSR